MGKTIRVPVVGELLLVVSDPDGAGTTMMVDAIARHGRIVADEVRVEFSGTLATFWAEVIRDGQVSLSLAVPEAAAAVQRAGDEEKAARMAQLREDGHRFLVYDASDRYDPTRKEFARALGLSDAGVVASALYELGRHLADQYQGRLWSNEGLDLTELVALASGDEAEDFWQACGRASNMGPVRVEAVQRFVAAWSRLGLE